MVPGVAGLAGGGGVQDPSVLDLVEAEEQDGEDGEQQYGDSDHWRIPSADDTPPCAPTPAVPPAAVVKVL